MQNIGERLEEARKRQGISIREAAEATKIRGDFLLNMEANKFDFGLPEVYQRGFLKLYARYLKLDVERIATDYSAFQMGANRYARRDGREIFGRTELPPVAPPAHIRAAQTHEEDDDEEPDTSEGIGRVRPQSVRGNATEEGAETPSAQEGPGEWTLYLKIGGVFAGTLVLVLLLIFFLQAIFSTSESDDPVLTPGGTSSSAASSATSTTAPVGARSVVGPLKLTATGETYVMVRNATDGSTVSPNTLLSAGTTRTIEAYGTLEIFASAIQNLQIEQADGQIMRPQGTGLKKTVLEVVPR